MTLSAPGAVPPMFRRVDWLTLAATFVLMWVGYYLTLSPELTLQDSGELAVGSFYAGVPHPPGYPVWTIYTWLWTVLLPFGNIAWRVALGEATAGALACGLLGMLVSRGSSLLMEGVRELKDMTGKWENAICLACGVASGLFLGFNGFTWSQAVIVEVYLFSVLSFMVVLLCLLRWIYAPHQMRYAYWALFMFGVCFTNHQSLIVAAIGIEITLAAGDYKLGRDIFFGNFVIYLLYWLVFAATGQHIFANLGAKPGLLLIFNAVGLGSAIASGWFASRTKGFLSEWKHVIILGLLWVAGAAFYFYMPLAGMTNPPMQWGYPRTLEGFLHALTRGQYEQPNPTNLVAEPGRFLNQLGMLFANVGDEFTLVLAFLALVPFLYFRRLQRRERAWIIGLTSIYLCLGVLLMILLNPTPDRASADLVKVFFTASHVIVAAMVGYGLALTAAFMATHYGEFRRWGLLGAGVAVLLAVYELYRDVAKVYFGEDASPSWPEIMKQISTAFTPHHYGLPVFAGLLLLAMTAAFLAALLLYRKRAPLAVMLGLVAIAPLNLILNNWADNEQRGHYFGYWFGHDMFTPPFNGADGKPLYPEMTRDAVLYGGTDPGRFCPTYMIFCESFTPSKDQPVLDQKFDRRDVYIITQNALADGTYLNYIRAHYNRSQQLDPPFFQELARSRRERENNYETNLLARLISPLDTLFEGLGARIEKRRRTYTSWFTVRDFTNVPAFLNRLQPGPAQDPVSRFIYDNLSAATKQALGSPAKDSAVRGLVKDLNLLLDRDLQLQAQIASRQAEKNAVDMKILDGAESEQVRQKQERLAGEIKRLSETPVLWNPERFRQVKISDYLADFIKEDPRGFSRVRLNRLLLEAAYPEEIAASLGGVYPDREIYIATPEDSQRCFAEYLNDAQKRLQHDLQFPHEPKQIRGGEEVKLGQDGRVSVAGQVAVMSINGLLTKVMFDHNPKNEFFVEESFPLDWMYPHLSPFGIIMKINREQLPSLSEEALNTDHQFWRQYSKRLTGDIVDYDTPIKQVAEWVEKTYVKHDLTGFTGDPKFVRDNDAQKAFSKLRSSIAGVYAWRLSPQAPAQFRPKSAEEYQRLLKETEFAFRQAFAFCPYSPEAIFRYINLLLPLNRVEEALILAETCLKLDPYNAQVRGLVETLRGARGAAPTASTQALERQHQAEPGNVGVALELARIYFQLQQTGRGLQLLDQTLAGPIHSSTDVLMIAQAFMQLGDRPRLEKALEKLVQVTPESPEAWYDLAAFRAELGKTNEVAPALSNAIQLSAKRLGQKTPGARDLLREARNDPRFQSLHSNPEFKKLVPGA